ncbi:MAG: metallophosphoesterase [Elusimicrobiaceae bacterium]|nr:metallophosphoesterase [Elusimicrobiaceae bacterium]
MFLLSFTRQYNGFGATYLHILAHNWLGFIFLWFCFSMLYILLKICRLNLPVFLPLIIAVVLTLLATWTAFKEPLIKQIEIASPKIKRPLLLAQISDTHLGKNITPKRLEKALKEMSAYKPDLIVFTGDIFEEQENMQPYIDLIKNLKAPCGKYVISGNHEYYGGLAQNRELFKQAGLIDLDNKTTETCGLIINGVSDMPDMNFLNNLKPQKEFNILLQHQPNFFKELSPNIDLMLSGHTHAGQIWPFNYLVALRYKYLSGLYKHGESNLYVNPGTFYWGPSMRLFTHNEITLIKLNEK